MRRCSVLLSKMDCLRSDHLRETSNLRVFQLPAFKFSIRASLTFDSSSHCPIRPIDGV